MVVTVVTVATVVVAVLVVTVATAMETALGMARSRSGCTWSSPSSGSRQRSVLPCASSMAALERRAPSHHPAGARLFSQRFSCVSRACLGKRPFFSCQILACVSQGSCLGTHGVAVNPSHAPAEAARVRTTGGAARRQACSSRRHCLDFNRCAFERCVREQRCRGAAWRRSI